MTGEISGAYLKSILASCMEKSGASIVVSG
jgi:hypothetical protein